MKLVLRGNKITKDFIQNNKTIFNSPRYSASAKHRGKSAFDLLRAK